MRPDARDLGEPVIFSVTDRTHRPQTPTFPALCATIYRLTGASSGGIGLTSPPPGRSPISPAVSRARPIADLSHTLASGVRATSGISIL